MVSAELLQSFYRASIELLQSFCRPYTELARDLVLLTPRTQDFLASADQGPPAYSWAQDLLASSSASGGQGPQAYSRALGTSYKLVLARDLQLTPRPHQDLLSGLFQGLPAYSREGPRTF
jgi:hypothetical protein